MLYPNTMDHVLLTQIQVSPNTVFHPGSGYMRFLLVIAKTHIQMFTKFFCRGYREAGYSKTLLQVSGAFW